MYIRKIILIIIILHYFPNLFLFFLSVVVSETSVEVADLFYATFYSITSIDNTIFDMNLEHFHIL